jgi:hypothetical protein
MARPDFAGLRGEAERLPSRAFRVVAITLATGESLRTLVRSTDWMPVRVPRDGRSDAADSNAWIVRSLTICEALPRRRSIWLCRLEPQSAVRCLVFKGLDRTAKGVANSSLPARTRPIKSCRTLKPWSELQCTRAKRGYQMVLHRPVETARLFEQFGARPIAK